MYPLIWPGHCHYINKLNHWGWWRSSTEFSDDIRCTVWFMNDCLPISDLHLNINNRGSISCFPFLIPWASLCFSVHMSLVEISVLIEPIPLWTFHWGMIRWLWTSFNKNIFWFCRLTWLASLTDMMLWDLCDGFCNIYLLLPCGSWVVSSELQIGRSLYVPYNLPLFVCYTITHKYP